MKPRATGDVLISGTFNGALIAGSESLESDSDGDLLLARLSGQTGDFVWAKKLTADTTAAAPQVQLDSAGTVVVSGSFQNTIDLGDGSVSSQGTRDVFFLKLRFADGGFARLDLADGTAAWAERFGGAQSEFVSQIRADELTGSVVAVGSFSVLTQFVDRELIAVGRRDGYCVRVFPE